MKRTLPALPSRFVLASALLAAAGLALFSQPALAEVKTYGPELQRFSLDVPASWKEEPQDAGIRLVSPDGRAVVAAAVAPSEGKSAEALVRKIAGNLSGTGVKRLDESTFAFTCYVYLECKMVFVVAYVSIAEFLLYLCKYIFKFQCLFCCHCFFLP